MNSRLRWIASGIFILSSSLNYLDRQLLAALAPTLKEEFHLNNEQYGQVQSAFFFVYAFIAPLAGWFIDRVGLNTGAGIAVAAWSLAGSATALVNSFPGLLFCRTMLGAAEAAGIPSTGKAYATYLESKELGFGAALGQIGITLGSVAAPLLVAAIAPRWGWRAAFAFCGALGFVWLPLWWFISKRAPKRPATTKRPQDMGRIIRDPRLWGMILGNALVMTVYALWTNWITLYFVQERHLTALEANQRYAWIPAVFAGLGGLAGGWLTYRLISRGVPVLKARLRVSWMGAVVMLLSTALVPLMRTNTLAAAAISLSFFFTLMVSVNVYSMPIDVFGPARAAFGVAALGTAFGLMQTVISPWIGSVVDRAGFAPVCTVIAILPLLGVAVLHWSLWNSPLAEG